MSSNQRTSQRTRDPHETDEQREWLQEQFGELTTETVVLTPSEWAEQKRYLPQSVTQMPGFYSFDVAPYLREIVDCFAVDSPVREISVKKGAQVGYTVGVLENVLGYLIEHVKTAPTMFVTADAELAKLRMESNITPMIQHSGLDSLIKSTDETNKRKTGRTDKKIEWVGGGYLVPFGAKNANKLRSLSIQYLLGDETDGWPDVTTKDGDPVKLVRSRTASYETSRKIGHGSTPLLKGTSKIDVLFEQGDRRYYHVNCLACGHSQVLRWRRENKDTGEVTGIVWDTDEAGNLVPGSVRYLCENCSHPHINDDKTRLLSPEYGAEWRPTAKPTSPDHRSYHISALYSPVGMQTWEECVRMYLDAWDDAKARPKDNALYQVFYNNILGESFEIRGDRVRFVQVSPHRRSAYKRGEIPPTDFTVESTGSPILMVTGAVDVHGDNVKVATFGWCKDRRAFLLDYKTFEGDTEQTDDPGTWGRLESFITDTTYTTDDGKRFLIDVVLVDSNYRADQACEFCRRFPAGVFPIRGQGMPPKSPRIKEFSEFTTTIGTLGYGITVDLFKARWAAALKREWNGQGQQPYGHFNAPGDITDKELKELTNEVRVEKVDPLTKKRIGFEWKRMGANELWDLLIYNNAAVEIFARTLFTEWGEDAVNWPTFWDVLEHDPEFQLFKIEE